MALDVDAIYLDRALALTSDGDFAKITDWFDADGDECEPQDATCCVARLDRLGEDPLWLTIDLSAFEFRAAH